MKRIFLSLDSNYSMMNYFYLCFLLILPCSGICQIQPTPKSYHKIKFLYQKKSTLRLDEKGVYADTLQLKKMFPDVEFEKIKLSEENNNTVVGFVPIEKLNGIHKNEILNHLSSNNCLIYGTAYPKKDLIDFTVDYNSPETALAYYLFGKTQTQFSHTYSYTYLEKNARLEISSSGTKQAVAITKNQLTWINKDQLTGTFLVTEKPNTKKNQLIQIEKNLPRWISPIPFFENVQMGIKSIYDVEYDYQLITVSYE